VERKKINLSRKTSPPESDQEGCHLLPLSGEALGISILNNAPFSVKSAITKRRI